MKKTLSITQKILSKILESEKETKYTPMMFQPKRPTRLEKFNGKKNK